MVDSDAFIDRPIKEEPCRECTHYSRVRSDMFGQCLKYNISTYVRWCGTVGGIMTEEERIEKRIANKDW